MDCAHRSCAFKAAAPSFVSYGHRRVTGASAQEARGTLHGQVTDPQGAVIPRASVLIISEDTRVKQENNH